MMLKNHIIIIPFNLPWDWSTDYTNQTAYILGRKNVVICYMWADALSLKEHLLKKIKPRLIKSVNKNFHIFKPIYFVPFRRFKFISSLNQSINIFLLKLFVNYLELTKGRNKKIAWVFYPNLFPFIKLLGNKYFTVYDCVDYWQVGTEQEKKEVRNNEQKLLDYANVVVANSRVLRKHLKGKRKDVYLVPQGFRLDHFEKPVKSGINFSRKKPIIGYVGGINSRLDYSLLIALIKNHPDWHFVLWGPIQKDLELKGSKIKKNIKAFLSLPNVTLGVSKNKKEVPAIITQFDVGIIPYDISLDFNRFCYPMKVFEYFYLGKPVVSTPIEELKRFPKFVKIGKDANEWEKHISNLLLKPWPKKYKREQKKLAEENSWDNKVEKILIHLS